MNATAAPSAAPDRHLKLWSDGQSIFVEIPGIKGPYITKFDYNYRGCDLALSLLGQHRVDYEYIGTASAYTDTTKQPGTPMQRAMGEKILRARGVIK